MATPQPSPETLLQHGALRSAVAFTRCTDRTRLELTGRDRAAFLHGFCTNDVNRLATGQGCEAFLTNVQGKTIGFVNLFCEADRLVMDTAAGQGDQIIQSLDRYVIREDVQINEQDAAWMSFRVIGPGAPELLANLLGAAIQLDPLENLQTVWEGGEVHVRRVDFASDMDFLVDIPPALGDACEAALLRGGAVLCETPALEIARIEQGTPVYGRDISDANLPQEVDRNPKAISFTKGCYLGQETVARIDALGHVNRLLRGVRIASRACPEAGTEFSREGKPVGRVTSACWSVRLDAPLALAYVRREFSQPGSHFESPLGPAEVVGLPLE